MSMGEEAYQDMLCERAAAESALDSGKWRQRNGTYIRICDMTTSHIHNCINMLERQEDKIDEIGMGYLELFDEELKRRNK